MIANNQEINFASVKKWCKGENALFAFEDFLKKLKK
jgi:hypothetical protein